MGEQLWDILAHDATIAYEPWPTYDEAKCKDDTIAIGVQVNGKVRGTVEVSLDDDDATVKARGKEVPGVAKLLDGKTIVKEIYVKGKILNIVVK